MAQQTVTALDSEYVHDMLEFHPKVLAGFGVFLVHASEHALKLTEHPPFRRIALNPSHQHIGKVVQLATQASSFLSSVDAGQQSQLFLAPEIA